MPFEITMPQLGLTMERGSVVEWHVREGEIGGFLHLSQGQEAVPVGTCTALRPDDWFTSTHRGHGDVIAKGCEVKYMFAELYGRTTGYCKGKGGSMHIADFSQGTSGANGIVSGGFAAEVAAQVADRAFGTIDAPIQRVCAPSVPPPFARNMED